MQEETITVSTPVNDIMNIVGEDSIFDHADEIEFYLSLLPEVDMDTASYIKTKVQDEAEEAWMDKKWGYITAATGVGKSKMAINIIEKCYNIFKAKGIVPKILLVVPTENLRDSNWPDEFKKWGKEYLMEFITGICYKSLPTVKDQHYQLVILDEWHNITPLNSSYFYYNKTDALLALSATKPRDLLKLEVAAKLKMTEVFKVTLDTAVKLRLVTPYQLTVISVPLDDTDRYISPNKKNSQFKATEVYRNSYLSGLIEEYKKQLKGMFQMDADFNIVKPKFSDRVLRSMIKDLALKRMHMIYNLKSKFKAAQYILSQFDKDERILTFCGSIEHADALSENGQTFHSKLKGKDRGKHLDSFKAEEINRLTCVNSLNEGQNISNVDTGLIVQLNSNELHTIQRIGRALRYRPGHTAQVIILCAEGTQDEVWVKEALSSLESNNIRWIKLGELQDGTTAL